MLELLGHGKMRVVLGIARHLVPTIVGLQVGVTRSLPS